MTDRAAILAEIVELNAQPLREDDEFTLTEYIAALALRTGRTLTQRGAKCQLEKMVIDGVLSERKGVYVPETERACTVWRRRAGG